MRNALRATCALLVVAAAAGCSSPETDPPTIGGALPTSPPATSSTDPTSTGPADDADITRCTAADLTLEVGEPAGEGQRTLPLLYTNSSGRPCEAYGVPGVDLVGPDDPNGNTYSLPRPGAADEQARGTLQPGESATAQLTYLTDSPGSFGSLGSTGWVPTEIVTTPPGDTEQLRAPWPTGDTVSRQDSATRPGTFVDAFSTP